MPKLIGFAALKKLWEGPATFLFTLFPREPEKTLTVRYESHLENRRFDLYAPMSHLPRQPGGGFPRQILVTIGRNSDQMQTIGFQPIRKPVRVDREILTYVLAGKERQPINSMKYLALVNPSYALYVPHEVFADEEPPRELFLLISEPEQPLDKLLPFLNTPPQKS